jgi:ferritin-like metal-binding protein YciE
MVRAATSADLQQALHQHLEATREQVQRLEEIFEELNSSPQQRVCKGMAGLIEEGEEVLARDMEPELKDAALIASAQRVEHYEISAYGTLRAFAEQLGAGQAVTLLQQNLDVERASDHELSQIAWSAVNPASADLGDWDEDLDGGDHASPTEIARPSASAY